MTKTRKRVRSRGTTSRRPQPERASPAADLMAALREGVDSPTPGPLLGAVGLLLSVAAGADDPAASLDHLVRTFAGIDRTETSAALLAIATLTVDADLRRRVRREIADRGHVLPRWLADLHRTEPAERAVEISTVFGDADMLLVGVTVPGGHPLTAVVRIENEIGAVATDAFLAQAPVPSVAERLTTDDDPDLRVRDISPADARARIDAGLRELDVGPVPVGSEGLAGKRPLVEWMLSLLPEGGEDSVLPELSDDQLDEIADRFLAGPFGPSWSDDDRRALLAELLAAANSTGVGDPLVWSARRVRLLLDPSLLLLDLGTPQLERLPDLLRDLIRYGHAERGLRPGLTDDALAAVDASADAFRRAVRELDEDDED